MSGAKKITRHLISSSETHPLFFLGIVSSEPDYRLSVLINLHLETDLRKCDSELLLKTPSGNQWFSCFSCKEQGLNLVANRNGSDILLRKLKNIDFIMVAGDTNGEEKAKQLAIRLRDLPGITAVFVFNSRDVKEKNLLLLNTL